MAAGVHQDRGLREPLQSMVDQTDVGMAKEDRGPMTSIGLQETASSARQPVIAVSRSRIADVFTTVAQELDAEEAGAQSHLTTEGTNYGGTAGEEDDPNQQE